MRSNETSACIFAKTREIVFYSHFTFLECCFFSVAMEASDDEEIIDGQHRESTIDSSCLSVSSDERTTGKLGSLFHLKSTLSPNLPELNCRTQSHSLN